MNCDLCNDEVDYNKTVVMYHESGNVFFLCGKTCQNKIEEGKAFIIDDVPYKRSGKAYFTKKENAVSFLKFLNQKGYFVNNRPVEEMDLPDSNFYGMQWFHDEDKGIVFTTKATVFKHYA